MPSVRVSSMQIVFSSCILTLQAILLNGYALNLLRLPADPVAIFLLSTLELAALAALARRLPLRVERDPLGLAGFLLVGVGTFAYFIAPTLPSLYAPSYSGDPALHLDFIYRVFATGRIIGDDPGGPSLIAATFAHWLAWEPVRVMHPTAALWLALSAGGVYGITRSTLTRSSATIALVAPFALYLSWTYFAGVVMAANYFYSQAAGQMFLVAGAWYLAEYRRRDHALYLALAAMAFISMGVTYQLWMLMPAVMLAWILFQDARRGGAARQRALTLLLGGGALALAVAATYLLQPRLFPTFDRFRLEAAVHSASIGGLGGWFLLLPAIGIVIAGHDSPRAFALIFLAGALAEIAALWIAHVFLGSARYWLLKTLFLLPFPLAVLSVFPLARAAEWLRRQNWRVALAPVAGFVAAFALGALGVLWLRPPYAFEPLTESDIQVALWAKRNLDTRQIHYLGPKGVTAQTIGYGIWGEKYPGDLFLDLARLGPRTFEEWRNDPLWGDYLLISSGQYVPSDPTLVTLFRSGDSAIFAKPNLATTASTHKLGTYGDVFTLSAYRLPIASLYAGETLTVTAQLAPLRVPSQAVVWRLQLRDRQNNAAAEARVLPFDDKFPLQRFPVGKNLTQDLVLPLSPETRAGLYHLELGLYRIRDGGALTFSGMNGEQDDVLRLGLVKIVQPQISDHALAASVRTDWRFADFAILRAVRVVKQSPIRPGDSFRVDLHWQAERRGENDYTVSVQLLDARGNLVTQQDNAPRGGAYPTLIWNAGEIVADSYTLTTPRDAAPGEYRLIVSMYHWQTLQRVPVFTAEKRAQGDFAPLPLVVQIGN